MTVTATLTNTPNSIEIRGTSTGKDATKLFKVSLSSGNVRLVTNGNIDRETTTQFVLVLRYVGLNIYINFLCLKVYLNPFALRMAKTQ